MKPRISWLAAFFLAVCLATVCVAQDDTRYKELPNFHQVDERLFRGAQPNAGGIQKLKELGIRTIINLRDDDENASAEASAARAAGLQYFNVPMSTFNRPADKTVAQVLSVISANENQPVFVHCRRGSDRTGTIIAIYRIEHDGWTSEKATSEAKRYGLGLWQLGMKDYISDYYRRRTQERNSTIKSAPLTTSERPGVH
jgi:tyrosine-protein phosphatase SIW14